MIRSWNQDERFLFYHIIMNILPLWNAQQYNIYLSMITKEWWIWMYRQTHINLRKIMLLLAIYLGNRCRLWKHKTVIMMDGCRALKILNSVSSERMWVYSCLVSCNYTNCFPIVWDPDLHVKFNFIHKFTSAKIDCSGFSEVENFKGEYTLLTPVLVVKKKKYQTLNS